MKLFEKLTNKLLKEFLNWNGEISDGNPKVIPEETFSESAREMSEKFFK